MEIDSELLLKLLQVKMPASAREEVLAILCSHEAKPSKDAERKRKQRQKRVGHVTEMSRTCPGHVTEMSQPLSPSLSPSLPPSPLSPTPPIPAPTHTPPHTPTHPCAHTHAREEGPNQPEFSLIAETPESPKPTVDGFVEFWNSHDFVQEVKVLTDSRKNLIRRRIKDEFFMRNVDEAMEIASNSRFLRGETPPAAGHKQFKLTVDWFLNENNFAKILEGNYSNDKAIPAYRPPTGL